MTHFDNLDEEQKDAIKGIYLSAFERRMEDERFYINQLYRLLVLGSGAGIALLVAFMGGMLSNGNSIKLLVPALWKFFIGAVSATSIYILLGLVASDAVNHIEKELKDFFLNKKEIENIQGYGLSGIGRIVLLILAVMSLTFFIWGVFQCAGVLDKL